jgi:hypothetical protein
MQMQATTDIPGIPLEHAFAAGLLTKQFSSRECGARAAGEKGGDRKDD